MEVTPDVIADGIVLGALKLSAIGAVIWLLWRFREPVIAYLWSAAIVCGIWGVLVGCIWGVVYLQQHVDAHVNEHTQKTVGNVVIIGGLALFAGWYLVCCVYNAWHYVTGSPKRLGQGKR